MYKQLIQTQQTDLTTEMKHSLMKLLCSSAETLLTTEDRSSFRGYQVMNVAFLFLSFL